MLGNIIQGWTLGIATGNVCLMTCSPVYLPFLLLEDRSIKKSVAVVLKISLGRFIAYLIFGFFAGLIGAGLGDFERIFFSSVAFILLSVYLIINTFGISVKGNNCRVNKILKFTKKPFILGFLTGINFCPSFLLVLSGVVNLGSVWNGLMLFFGFFAGTTIFLIPFAFISQLAQYDFFKMVAKIITVVVACYFLLKGFKGILFFNVL